jgi:histone acetyltransferase MYST1
MRDRHIVEVGNKYHVEWKNGQQHVGEIIEIRRLRGVNSSSSHTVVQNNSYLTNEADNPEDYEYYVHYQTFDRRLDEWVAYKRIDISNEMSGERHNRDSMKSRKNKRKLLIDCTAESKIDDKEVKLLELEREHDEITKVKNINSIVLGRYEIETWYYSPYPDEFVGEELMHVCEYCLKYMKKPKTLYHHHLKCHKYCPPGVEIYRDNDLTMYEVDGHENKIYCQNLCLLSKLFLDHKTLYYDVNPFLFYVLCEVDKKGYNHIVGYFSKEKHSIENYNLACILTFPPYQRKGYGKFLMSVSYELSKRENTTGSPEKPLSDLGKISYRSYWTFVLMQIFNNKESISNISIQEISRMTGFKTEDILSTLHYLNMIKHWKGQHVICVSQKAIDNHLQQVTKVRLCKPECLTWKPFSERPPKRQI